MTSEYRLPEAFISYSRTDGEFVSQLQTDLAAAQFETWRDVHSLRAGDRWPRKLGDAIAAAPSFILIWSAAAAASDFVELEWTVAIALKRTICIIALDESAVPATLSPFETKRSADAKEAARWLLNQTPRTDAPSAAAVDRVLQTLSATPDTTGAKQIAGSLAIGYLSQTASNVQGNILQAAGTVHVYLGEQRATPVHADASIPLFRSNIASRGKLPFVGRQDLIAQIDSLLTNTRKECVVVLHGAPGVGKSELAREFARLRRERYAGGTFAIDASTNGFALEFASLGQKILALTFPPEMKLDDRGVRTFLALSRDPVLMIYDNVVSFEQARPCLPYSGMPCHVLITTLLDRPTQMWSCLEVMPLTPAQSVELAEKVTDGKLDEATARSVARHSGGLPV